MASIHRQSGRSYWYASFRDATGKYHFVSTKIQHTPDGANGKERATNAANNRRLAQDMATRLEEAEVGNATEAHLRKLLSDVSERVNQSRLEFKTVDVFLNDWIARAEKTKSAGTHERYSGIVKNFLKSLGAKAKAKLADVSVRDVQKFIQDRLEGGRNPSTVRTDCKILNAPFALALRQGLTLSNPVAAAEIPEGAKESRSPFTSEQVGDLLKACNTLAKEDADNAGVWKEWKTCILIGFYTGVRLGDAVAMPLSAFDFDKHVLKVRPQKTSRKKRDLIIPLHPQLEAHVLDLPVGDNQGPLCPTLAKRKVSGKYGLSIQFHKILSAAEVKQETIEATGKAGHDFNKYTFHSLRHSFVSELANAGIAPDVRQMLAGHSDDRSHAVYTHTQLDTLRAAVKKLPSIKR
ncbi:MAG TPA: site-specific integrase [Verrucomicrobiota bacterium]|nr:site-specific integrase [Verrucomicrobiota bacterium]